MRMNVDLKAALAIHRQSLLIAFDRICLKDFLDGKQRCCDIDCARRSSEVDETEDGSIAVLCRFPGIEK